MLVATLRTHPNYCSMRIPAFYALVRGVGLADYWHFDSECFIVKSIAPAERLPGNGHRMQCPYCALLNKPVPVGEGKAPNTSAPPA